MTDRTYRVTEIVGTSKEGLNQAIGVPERQLCNACFHGRYPMPIDGLVDKLGLERARL